MASVRPTCVVELLWGCLQAPSHTMLEADLTSNELASTLDTGFKA